MSCARTWVADNGIRYARGHSTYIRAAYSAAVLQRVATDTAVSRRRRRATAIVVVIAVTTTTAIVAVAERGITWDELRRSTSEPHQRTQLLLIALQRPFRRLRHA